MQQPAYWAVPPGSNPPGVVTVPYAGAAGTQVQNQGQVQVCRVITSVFYKLALYISLFFLVHGLCPIACTSQGS